MSPHFIASYDTKDPSIEGPGVIKADGLRRNREVRIGAMDEAGAT